MLPNNLIFFLLHSSTPLQYLELFGSWWWVYRHGSTEVKFSQTLLPTLAQLDPCRADYQKGTSRVFQLLLEKLTRKSRQQLVHWDIAVNGLERCIRTQMRQTEYQPGKTGPWNNCLSYLGEQSARYWLKWKNRSSWQYSMLGKGDMFPQCFYYLL
jgi:hypothetical protein